MISCFIFRKTSELGKDLIKVIALVHVFDGTQGLLNGILRALGAQLYASVVMFFGLMYFNFNEDIK